MLVLQMEIKMVTVQRHLVSGQTYETMTSLTYSDAKGPVKTMNANRKQVYEQLKCNNPKFVVLHTEYNSIHVLMLNMLF